MAAPWPSQRLSVVLAIVIWFYYNVQFGLEIKRFKDPRVDAQLLLVTGISAGSVLVQLPFLVWFPNVATTVRKETEASPTASVVAALAHTTGLAFTCFAFFCASLPQVQVLKSFAPVFSGLWAYALLGSSFGKGAITAAGLIVGGCALFSWTSTFNLPALVLCMAASTAIPLRNVLMLRLAPARRSGASGLDSALSRLFQLNLGTATILFAVAMLFIPDMSLASLYWRQMLLLGWQKAAYELASTYALYQLDALLHGTLDVAKRMLIAGAGFMLQEAPPTPQEAVGLAMTCMGLMMWSYIKSAKRTAPGSSGSASILPEKTNNAGAGGSNDNAHRLRRVLQLLLPAVVVGCNMFAVRLIATSGSREMPAVNQQPAGLAGSAGGVYWNTTCSVAATAHRVGVGYYVGNLGVGSLGDDASFAVYMETMRAALQSHSKKGGLVVTRYPSGRTLRTNDNVEAALRGVDFVTLGGGATLGWNYSMSMLRSNLLDSVPKLIFGSGSERALLTSPEATVQAERHRITGWWRPLGQPPANDPSGFLFGGVRGELSLPAAPLVLNTTLPVAYDSGLLAARYLPADTTVLSELFGPTQSRDVPFVVVSPLHASSNAANMEAFDHYVLWLLERWQVVLQPLDANHLRSTKQLHHRVSRMQKGSKDSNKWLLVHDNHWDHARLLGLYSAAAFSVSTRLSSGILAMSTLTPNLYMCFENCLEFRDVAGSVGMWQHLTVVPQQVSMSNMRAMLQQWQDSTTRLFVAMPDVSRQLFNVITKAHLMQLEHMQHYWGSLCRQRPCLCAQLQAADVVELLGEIHEGGAVVRVQASPLFAEARAGQPNGQAAEVAAQA